MLGFGFLLLFVWGFEGELFGCFFGGLGLWVGLVEVLVDWVFFPE